MPSLLSSWALTLASIASLARGLDVPVTFFTSIDCKTVSNITADDDLALSTCYVTPGLVSLHYDTISCAGGGTVLPYIFSDTACAEVTDDWYKTGDDFHCHSDYASGSIAAIMLSCNQDEPEKPDATSTIEVGPVATGSGAAATNSPSSGSGGNSTDDSNGDSNNDNNTNNKTGWASLSNGAHIGIIAGAAGLVLISFLGFCWRLYKARQVPKFNPSNTGGHQSYNNQQPPGYPPPPPTWKSPEPSVREISRPDPTYRTESGLSSPDFTSRTDSALSPRPTHAELYGQGSPPPVNHSSPPPHYASELPGDHSSDLAFQQVLGGIPAAARENAASMQFATGQDVNGINAQPSATVSAAFSKRDPQWKHKLGGAGEFYMFEYLRNLQLPNFGLHNWTSSVRKTISSVPGYQAIGTSHEGIADFEYYDEQGAFTEFLLAHGYSSQGIERGMRPKYYIEVKTTTSTNWQAPLYFTQDQKRNIEESWITPNQKHQVYIICRLFSLGSGRTRMQVYLDPEALRRAGHLRFTPGVGEHEGKWVVQPV